MNRTSEDDHPMALIPGRNSRIAEWMFNRYGKHLPTVQRENALARLTFRVLCVLDILIGLAWLLQSGNRSISQIYAPIRSVFGFLPGDAVRWWGGMLLVLGIGALVASFRRSEERTMLFVTGLVMYWTYWAISDLYGIGGANGSFVSTPFALFAVTGHLRVAASSHRITRRAYDEPEPTE